MASAAALLAVRTLLTTKPPGVVALSGTLVEKCPTAGCWFYLKDNTGTVKVDLASAGFSIADLPLGTQVMATGTKQVEGSETSLCATGLRY